MLELFVNEKKCDLIGNEKISIDFAMLSIDDISKRKGTRSYTFELPKTNNNRIIFEVSEQVNNLTQLPYTKLPARLVDNGIDLGIKFIELVSVKENYSVNLYGDNASFFDIIKNKKLRQTDLSEWNHVWDFTTITDSRNNTEGYIYPIINYGSDTSIMGNIARSLVVAWEKITALLPALFMDTVLEQICTDAGYTLSNAMLDDTTYTDNPIIIPSVGLGSGNKYNAVFGMSQDAQCVQSVYSAPYVNIMNIDSIVSYTGNYYSLPYDSVFKKMGIISFGKGIRIEDVFTCKLTFTLTIENLDTFHRLLVIYMTGNSNYNSGRVVIASVVVAPGTHTYTLEAAMSDSISQWNGFTTKMFFPVGNPLVTVKGGGTLEISEADEQVLIYENANVNVASILPDITQADLIRNYCQMLGLLISVDEDAKEVRLQKFNKIEENISVALDWSNKLDLKAEPEIKFMVEDYAQNNSFSWEKDEQEQQPVGTNGNLVVNNDNLHLEKELIKLDFASTYSDLQLLGIPIPRIGIYENLLFKSEKKPRLLILYRKAPNEFVDTGDFTYQFFSQFFTISGSDLMPLCRFIDTEFDFNLGFDNNLLEYYRAVRNVLTDYKKVTCFVKLDASDINTLDLLKPVYIRYFNSYFYVNSINGYSAGQTDSTEVELIKIF